MTTAVSAPQMLEAAPEDVGMSSQRLENVTALVQRYLDDGRYAGAISMVARRGQVVHFETYGQMDIEAGKAMQPDTIFRAYSMTKPIASVALMSLYEEGRFQLDDPASLYIPEFKDLQVLASGTADQYEVRPPTREMTVRDLLMHTSGLVGAGPTTAVGQLYQRDNVKTIGGEGTLAETAAKLGALPLYCDPGSQWNYGISTDMVGYLCERISGVPFDRFLSDRIFEPLGMPDTGFHVRETEIDRFAANYRRTPDGEAKFELIDSPATSPYATPRTYFSGAAGLVSTAADYMRFSKMLAAGGELDGTRILGSRTLAYMATNHLPEGRDLAGMGRPQFGETTMEGIGFGLGFAVLLDPARAQILGTPGEFYWGGAASTAFFVSPKEDLIMLFLTQLMPSSSYPIRRELRATVYASIVD
ncbi:MAG TPA: serine hydrolase domain-containing protein [Dehalococcoidia bacterium]|nr:serine hydrolase domain-containing protein [Dehalococcoidia bacterium]